MWHLTGVFGFLAGRALLEAAGAAGGEGCSGIP